MPQIRRRRINKKMIIKAIFKKMILKIMSTIRRIPVAVLAIAVIVFFQVKVLPAAFFSAIPTISYVTLIFGMTITSCFNRSRGFFILLILFLSQLGLTGFVPASIEKSFTSQEIYSMISVVLPLNLLFFSSVKERGIFSSWGQRSLIVILLQTAFIIGLTLPGDRALFSGINGRILGLSFMPETTIPDIAQITFIITGILLSVRRRRADIHFKTASLGVLIAIAFAHHFHNIPSAIPWFYGVAGVIIIFAVFQDNYFKAYMDELTGLPSRRSLNEDMMELNSVYVIAMVDVDYFKNFNDTYGHDAGDDVLRLIASVMRDFKDGKPFRYGGEEFTILFPGKRLAEVMPCLEELREKIAQCKFVLRGAGRGGKGAVRKLSITVSIGVAESNHKTISPEQVIKVADTALYRAKDNGRNCVSE